MRNLGDIPARELEHYGVKGMKWGVRRSQEQLDRSAGRRKKPSSSEIKEARSRHNKRIDEIDKGLNRVSYSNSRAAKQRSLNDVKKMLAEASSSDDISIGAKMTKGEAVTSIITGGPLGPVIYSGSLKSSAKYSREILAQYGDLTLDDFYDNSENRKR